MFRWLLLIASSGLAWQNLETPPSTGLVPPSPSDVPDLHSESAQAALADTLWSALQELVRPGPDADTISAVADSMKLLDTSAGLSDSAIHPAHVLTHLFGVPAEALADRIPRNFSHVVHLLVDKITRPAAHPAFSPSLYSMVGFLQSIGHPGLSAAVHLHNDSASSMKIRLTLAALQGGIEEATRSFAALQEAEPEEASASMQLRHPGWDLPGLCYWLGAKAGDLFGALAFGFHTLHGLTASADFQIHPRHSRHTPSLRREPQPAWKLLSANDASSSTFSSDCRVAINVLNSHALYSVNQSNVEATMLHDPVHRAVEYRIPRGGRPDFSGGADLPWESKEHADWVNFAAKNKDPQGVSAQARLAYQGHHKSNIAPNQTEGMELFKRSAADGDGQSAWALLLLHLRSRDFESKDDRGAIEELMDIVLWSDQAIPSQKAFARHVQYRYGIGQDVDPVEAGLWLERSAEMGELNAMMMMADAYAGRLSLSNVSTPNMASNGTLVRNDEKALRFWKLALEGGVQKARLNIVDHVLSGRDPSLTTESERCWEAYKHVHSLIMHEHPMLTLLHALARRSFEIGDSAGALLIYSFLSELGSAVAARNAADLWASLHNLKSFEPAVQCPAANVSECQLFYLRRAAALGDTEAMHLVSKLEHARGNDDAAFKWVNHAAGLGDLRGRFERALWLSRGVGDVEANATAALEELQALQAAAGEDFGVHAAALFGQLWLHAKEAVRVVCHEARAKLVTVFLAVAILILGGVMFSRR